MGEHKTKQENISAKAMDHRKAYEAKFAELKRTRLLLEEDMRALKEKIDAHLTAETQLQARWAAITELLEGVEQPISGAVEPAPPAAPTSLPHIEKLEETKTPAVEPEPTTK